jgi:hypothetical protein
MSVCISDMELIIHYAFAPPKQTTMNSTLSFCMFKSICQKRSSLWPDMQILHPDNVPFQTALSIKHLLVGSGGTKHHTVLETKNILGRA